MTPKLPPLPAALDKAIHEFARAAAYYEYEGRVAAKTRLETAIQAYALEAIKAQGVPDEREAFEKYMASTYPGVNLTRRIDGEYWSTTPDNFWDGWQARAALASAPPAPQASEVPEEDKPTAPASESDMQVYDAIAANYHKDKASVVKQAPVGIVISYLSVDGHTKWTFQPNKAAWTVTQDSKALERGARSCFEVYTRPAPVREPLTLERVVALWGDKSDGPSNAEIVSFARAIEAAHGIKE